MITFDSQFYWQMKGTAMAKRFARTYPNLTYSNKNYKKKILQKKQTMQNFVKKRCVRNYNCKRLDKRDN